MNKLPTTFDHKENIIITNGALIQHRDIAFGVVTVTEEIDCRVDTPSKVRGDLLKKMCALKIARGAFEIQGGRLYRGSASVAAVPYELPEERAKPSELDLDIMVKKADLSGGPIAEEGKPHLHGTWVYTQDGRNGLVRTDGTGLLTRLGLRGSVHTSVLLPEGVLRVARKMPDKELRIYGTKGDVVIQGDRSSVRYYTQNPQRICPPFWDLYSEHEEILAGAEDSETLLDLLQQFKDGFVRFEPDGLVFWGVGDVEGIRIDTRIGAMHSWEGVDEETKQKLHWTFDVSLFLSLLRQTKKASLIALPSHTNTSLLTIRSEDGSVDALIMPVKYRGA